MDYGMKVTFYIGMEDFEKFRNGEWVSYMGAPRDKFMKVKSEINDVETKEGEGNRYSTSFVRRRKVIESPLR